MKRLSKDQLHQLTCLGDARLDQLRLIYVRTSSIPLADARRRCRNLTRGELISRLFKRYLRTGSIL